MQHWRIAFFSLVMLTSLLPALKGQPVNDSIPEKVRKHRSNPPQNYLQINWGLQHLQHQDLIFSPLIHRKMSLANGGIHFLHLDDAGEVGGNLHRAGLQFSLFAPRSGPAYDYLLDGESVPAWSHSFTFVNLYYQWQKRVFRNQENELFAGLRLDNHVWAKSYSLGRSGTFGYFASFGLKAVVSGNKDVSSWLNPQFEVALPLVAWVARSPYLANDDEFIENISSNKGLNTFFAYLGDGKLQTWNRLQSLDLMVGNRVDLSQGKYKLGLHYQMSLLHHSRPLGLVHLQQGLSASFSIPL